MYVCDMFTCILKKLFIKTIHREQMKMKVLSLIIFTPK